MDSAWYLRAGSKEERSERIRQLKESAFIRTFGERETVILSINDRNINRNAGTDLNDRWLPALLEGERRRGVDHSGVGNRLADNGADDQRQ